MILQPLTRNLRRKTVLKAGFLIVKVLIFLPLSLLAQIRATEVTTAPIAFSADVSMQTFGQDHADFAVVTNDRLDHE